MRLGDLEVTTILDAEGTSRRSARSFRHSRTSWRKAPVRSPELFRGADWWLPIQAVRIRPPDAVVLVDTGLGLGRFVREGQGFRWEPAKDDGAPVE
jgi:hypothetical protein